MVIENFNWILRKLKISPKKFIIKTRKIKKFEHDSRDLSFGFMNGQVVFFRREKNELITWKGEQPNPLQEPKLGAKPINEQGLVGPIWHLPSVHIKSGPELHEVPLPHPVILS